MVNFPAQIPDCNSYDHVLLDFLFLLTLLSVIQWISHLPEILIHVVVSVSTDFLLNSKRGAHFYWDGLHDHMKDVPREDIFKLGASAAAEFCEWLELMYISPIKNIRPSLSYLYGFQPLVLLPWSIEITFFHLHQQNKSSKSKMKFRQASNHCKSVLEASK